jgi:hypothetical protein
MATIPASEIVNVNPNVLAAGGSGLDLLGLLLTNSARIPIGTVPSFATAASVGSYFGSSSVEKTMADIYFGGFEGSARKPSAVRMAQYNAAAVAAWVRGATLQSMTLAQLQALNALLSVVIDGVTKSATINLAAATSFSNAALLIQAALAISGPSSGVVTGSIAGTLLTVTGVASGSLAVGQVLSGTGVTSGTYISALGSGTGGTGTYTISPSQNMSSSSLTIHDPAVSFDSVQSAFRISSGTAGSASTIAFPTGALATSLKLTEVLGAVRSPGADAAVPGAFMDAVVAVTQNWAVFTTLFDPDASGFANKELFAIWANASDDRYGYAAWDTDAAPKATAPATSSFGYAVHLADYSGVFVLSAPDAKHAAFVCGIAPSIDFAQTAGRTNYCFRRQSGLVASVTDADSAANLISNGYNFYGAYGTANDEFVWLYDGHVSGPFTWMDGYVNQIWLNNAFQLALMILLRDSLSIPYTASGRGLIQAALQDSIDAGLNFGAFSAGVVLSSAQKADVDAAAGVPISRTIETRGWYLQVLPASAAVRSVRGTPPCNFWYADAGSVQHIELASIALQ